MAKRYFAPLVPLPTVITAPGRYLTRSGTVVTVEIVSDRHDFGCVGYYGDSVTPAVTGFSTPVERWHKSGRLYATSESSNDIVRRHAED